MQAASRIENLKKTYGENYCRRWNFSKCCTGSNIWATWLIPKWGGARRRPCVAFALWLRQFGRDWGYSGSSRAKTIAISRLCGSRSGSEQRCSQGANYYVFRQLCIIFRLKQISDPHIENVLNLMRLEPYADKLSGILGWSEKTFRFGGLGLLHQPRCWSLTSQTVGLDIQSRIAIWGILKELKKEPQGDSINLRSHYIEEIDALAGMRRHYW
jgi:hypothetical protein